jgi:hypothetical protein
VNIELTKIDSRMIGCMRVASFEMDVGHWILREMILNIILV